MENDVKGKALRASEQGFLGDLAFRWRLFRNPAKVIEVLNEAEAIDESLEQIRQGAQGADGVDRGTELLIDAHVAAGAAKDKLRRLVLGDREVERQASVRLAGLAESWNDGPEACAALIDQGEHAENVLPFPVRSLR